MNLAPESRHHFPGCNDYICIVNYLMRPTEFAVNVYSLIYVYVYVVDSLEGGEYH